MHCTFCQFRCQKSKAYYITVAHIKKCGPTMRGIPFLFRFFKISRSKYGWKQSSLTGKPTRFNLLFLTPPVGNLLTPLCHKKTFSTSRWIRQTFNQESIDSLTCREKFIIKQIKALTLFFRISQHSLEIKKITQVISAKLIILFPDNSEHAHFM